MDRTGHKELGALVGHAKRGGLSRRDFITRAVAAGATIATAKALWADKAAASSPKKGGIGRIAFATSSPQDTLDPIKVESSVDASRCQQLYNELTRISEDLTVEPRLATEWEPTGGDLSRWTFKLREGVEFHNGKELTADDVIYSMQRHLGEDSESVFKVSMQQIEDVRADGKYVVQFTLTGPNAEFPVLFTSGRTHIVPEGHTDFDNPIGTGPFKVNEFRPGVISNFVRFENYWNVENVHLDAVEAFSIPDPVNRLNAVFAGESHFMLGVDVNAMPRVEASDDVELQTVRAGQIVYLTMMCDRPPTDDYDFRMGMKYLQDRQRVIDGVYKGLAQMGNDHCLSPSDPMYAADIPIRPYDPDKARFHLKKAGMENPTVDIYTSTAAGPGGVEQALMFQETAKAGGVTVNVRTVPADGYWNSTWMKQAFNGSHWNMRPTADTLWTQMYMSDAPYNETMFKDNRVDDLVYAARSEPDLTKRKQMWHDLQYITYDEGGCLYSAFPDYINAHAASLKGTRPHPLGSNTTFFSGENIWLDS